MINSRTKEGGATFLLHGKTMGFGMQKGAFYNLIRQLASCVQPTGRAQEQECRTRKVVPNT